MARTLQSSKARDPGRGEGKGRYDRYVPDRKCWDQWLVNGL